jgi:formate hydrogenlyase subunit 6/NADH:ubiquinone oxidoreductase subunit I
MRILPLAIKNIFKKPFTHKYPYKPIILISGSRGDFTWVREKCIFCKICEMNCPAYAIKVDKEKKNYEMDIGKCVFCGTCEENCPTKAIHFKEQIAGVETKRKVRKFQ